MPTAAPILTDRGAELVATIERLTADRGYAPSLRELADALGVTHTRIAILAKRAEAAGALTHERRIARSWRLTAAGKAARRRRPARRGAMVEA